MDLGIAGKKALIVGGSQGLGAACAERLAEAGCRLHLVARSADALAERAETFGKRYGTSVETTSADMTNATARSELVDSNSDTDILVMSGSWPGLRDISQQWTLSDWQAALDVMLMPQIDLVSRLYPGMAQRGFGRIVIITSRLIKDPTLDLAMPATARLGLTGYLKALSREVASRGVTVNSILPGVFGTDTQLSAIARTSDEHRMAESEVIKGRLHLTPAGRLGRPDELGSLCAFLCSENAGFMTGQAVVMDGGAHTGIW